MQLNLYTKFNALTSSIEKNLSYLLNYSHVATNLTNVESDLSDSTFGKCSTTIDGIPTEKHVGDTWNGEEPCVKYICETGPNNTVQQRSVREYCFLKCNNVSIHDCAKCFTRYES